jgi:hypothetical protein
MTANKIFLLSGFVTGVINLILHAGAYFVDFPIFARTNDAINQQI